MTEHSPRRRPSYQLQRLSAERNRLARMYAIQRERLERINAEYHRFERMCETQRAREEAGWGDPPEIPPDSDLEFDEPPGRYAFRACLIHPPRRPGAAEPGARADDEAAVAMAQVLQELGAQAPPADSVGGLEPRPYVDITVSSYIRIRPRPTMAPGVQPYVRAGANRPSQASRTLEQQRRDLVWAELLELFAERILRLRPSAH